jgi:hypothetical protein
LRISGGTNLTLRAEEVWVLWRKIRLANPGRAMRVRLEEREQPRAIAIVRWSRGALSGIASDEWP